MENYKSASQQKLRYQTSKGLLNTEQLWDLNLNELDALAVALVAELESSGKKSFLVKTSAKDKTVKLKFDIVLDVLNTKSEEAQALKDAAEIKAHNSKIINLISEKQDESLRVKSVKQLEAMLK